MLFWCLTYGGDRKFYIDCQGRVWYNPPLQNAPAETPHGMHLHQLSGMPYLHIIKLSTFFSLYQFLKLFGGQIGTKLNHIDVSNFKVRIEKQLFQQKLSLWLQIFEKMIYLSRNEFWWYNLNWNKIKCYDNEFYDPYPKTDWLYLP